jgi:hypothetical protein
MCCEYGPRVRIQEPTGVKQVVDASLYGRPLALSET